MVEGFHTLPYVNGCIELEHTPDHGCVTGYVLDETDGDVLDRSPGQKCSEQESVTWLRAL